MIELVENNMKFDHQFDLSTKRHYINDTLVVLHCHHYTSLYTQLALDAGETEVLKDSARVSFKDMLNKYLTNNNPNAKLDAIVEIGCEYYSLIGLGKMKVNFLGFDSGEVELLSSHTDSGWIKKWGKYDKPINYITAGYIEALFEIILCQADKTFEAKEVQSIVMGDEISKFKVIRR